MFKSDSNSGESNHFKQRKEQYSTQSRLGFQNNLPAISGKSNNGIKNHQEFENQEKERSNTHWLSSKPRKSKICSNIQPSGEQFRGSQILSFNSNSQSFPHQNSVQNLSQYEIANRSSPDRGNNHKNSRAVLYNEDERTLENSLPLYWVEESLTDIDHAGHRGLALATKALASVYSRLPPRKYTAIVRAEQESRLEGRLLRTQHLVEGLQTLRDESQSTPREVHPKSQFPPFYHSPAPTATTSILGAGLFGAIQELVIKQREDESFWRVVDKPIIITPTKPMAVIQIDPGTVAKGKIDTLYRTVPIVIEFINKLKTLPDYSLLVSFGQYPTRQHYELRTNSKRLVIDRSFCKKIKGEFCIRFKLYANKGVFGRFQVTFEDKLPDNYRRAASLNYPQDSRRMENTGFSHRIKSLAEVASQIMEYDSFLNFELDTASGKSKLQKVADFHKNNVSKLISLVKATRADRRSPLTNEVEHNHASVSRFGKEPDSFLQEVSACEIVDRVPKQSAILLRRSSIAKVVNHRSSIRKVVLSGSEQARIEITSEPRSAIKLDEAIKSHQKSAVMNCMNHPPDLAWKTPDRHQKRQLLRNNRKQYSEINKCHEGVSSSEGMMLNSAQVSFFATVIEKSTVIAEPRRRMNIASDIPTRKPSTNLVEKCADLQSLKDKKAMDWNKKAKSILLEDPIQKSHLQPHGQTMRTMLVNQSKAAQLLAHHLSKLADQDHFIKKREQDDLIINHILEKSILVGVKGFWIRLFFLPQIVKEIKNLMMLKLQEIVWMRLRESARAKAKLAIMRQVRRIRAGRYSGNVGRVLQTFRIKTQLDAPIVQERCKQVLAVFFQQTSRIVALDRHLTRPKTIYTKVIYRWKRHIQIKRKLRTAYLSLLKCSSDAIRSMYPHAHSTLSETLGDPHNELGNRLFDCVFNNKIITFTKAKVQKILEFLPKKNCSYQKYMAYTSLYEKFCDSASTWTNKDTRAEELFNLVESNFKSLKYINFYDISKKCYLEQPENIINIELVTGKPRFLEGSDRWTHIRNFVLGFKLGLTKEYFICLLLTAAQFSTSTQPPNPPETGSKPQKPSKKHG